MKSLADRMTSYQTHKLIKEAIPNAHTVYEEENPQHQMTMEEWAERRLDKLEEKAM